MLTYFPTPYSDEILYSIVARFFKHLSISSRHLRLLLFGNPNMSPTLDFPTHLLNFHTTTGDILKKSIEQIIHDHTLLPLYAPFLQDHTLEKVKQSMKFKSGYIHIRTGLLSGIYSSLLFPRYCPLCFENDRRMYGEAYWHRAHQIPSIDICYIHHCLLFEIDLNFSSTHRSNFFPATENCCPNMKVVLVKSQNYVEVVQKAISYFEGNTNFDKSLFYYQRKFNELGFKQNKRRLDHSKIAESFNSFYSNDTLSLFKANLNKKDDWLKVVHRNAKASLHPIRHALLEYFLENFSMPKSRTDHEIESLVCINHLCPEYQKSNNTTYRIRYKSKRKTLLLKCNNCGMTYTRSYIEDKKKYFIRTKDYGFLWKEKLIQLRSNGLTYTQIGKILKCPEYTLRNNLKEKKVDHEKISAKDKANLNIKTEKRDQWSNLIKDNTSKTISQLIEMMRALYLWLYRNDKDWLFSQNYYKCKRKDGNIKLIDWHQRDLLLLNELKSVKKNLLNSNKPIRISKNALMHLSKKKINMVLRLHKLPLSSKFLEESVESIESFQLRKSHKSKDVFFRKRGENS